MSHRYQARSNILADRTTQVLEWASFDQQFQFQYPPGAPLLASGGYGAAKTVGAILKVHHVASMFPGYRWVVARSRWVDLQKTTMQTFFKWCPPDAWNYGGRRNDQEKILQYNNGSLVYWLHLDNLEEAGATLGGLEINGFLLDQAEEIPEEVFEKLKGRLGRWDKAVVPDHMIRYFEARYKAPWPWKNRQGKPEVPRYSLLTCNPDTEVHWLYRRFHPDSPDHHEPRGENRDKPSYRDQGYFMLFMDSRNNKFLSQQTLDEYMNNDESFIRRYVRGLWGIPEGRIHDISKMSEIEGSPELVQHLINSCTLMRVLDHGDSAPTACLWFAIDREGNWFVYREYYMPNRLISEHRREITGLSKGEAYTYNIADPQIFYKTAQKHGGRWSTADEYADCLNAPYTRETALFWTPGDNDEMSTRNRINELLKVDPNHIHPFLKTRGAPRIYFLTKTKDYPNGCDHIIRETRAQRKEKIGTYNGKPIFSDDRERKIDDHAYDTLRYGVASQATAGLVAQPHLQQFTITEVHRRALEARKPSNMRVMAKRAQLSLILGRKS